MDKAKLIEYWVETAEHDYGTMQHLYESGDYAWCLFIGHLVIEKLLKACYVKRHGVQAPFTHALLRLAELSGLEANDNTRATLTRLMQFHTRGRYPDVRREFYTRATKSFTTAQLQAIKETRQWLLKMLSA
jgi:HEPN domain-containing protein